MLNFQTLIRQLPARTDAAGLLHTFVPPPRFADKRFVNYRPDPAHPSQRAAQQRLERFAAELQQRPAGVLGWVRGTFGAPRRDGGGMYLDGGFGVGKTHLLAAVWHAAPMPKAYLSFDELVYAIGLLGVGGVRAAFADHRLVCVDEWELDDPGNLKMALAFLRGAVQEGVRVVTTSNTVPDELGRGRFSQKDFASEIEELSAAFEVLTVTGDDYRHRHFTQRPGRELFLPAAEVEQRAKAAGAGALCLPFVELVHGLEQTHPIRYAALIEPLSRLFVQELQEMNRLPDALRWVHFVDKLYDAAVPFAASAELALGGIFPDEFLTGAYRKKFSRCLSRMEEMLGETAANRAAGAAP